MAKKPAVPVITHRFAAVQVAQALRIDRHTVTGLFAREPGVIVIGNPETKRGQRKYRQLRVPQSVFNRVTARMTVRSR